MYGLYKAFVGKRATTTSVCATMSEMEHDFHEGVEEQAGSEQQDRHERTSPADSMDANGRQADQFLDSVVKHEKREQLFKEITFVKKALDKTFTGEGKPDTCESNWFMFRAIFLHNMKTFGIEEEQWGTHLFNSIDGKALQVVLSKPELQQSFDSMDRYFAAGPFRQAHTDFSVRTGFYDPKYRVRYPNQVKNLVQRFDKDASKAPTPMTDVEKIVALQYNVPAELRAAIMLKEDNTPFTSYDDLVRVLMARVNAAIPSGSSSKQQAANGQGEGRGNTPKRQRTGHEQHRTSFEQSRRGSSDQQQRGNGAGSSSGGGAKGNGQQPRVCVACNQPGHKPWEKDADGKPKCPNFDPAKVPRKVVFQRKS